MNNIERVDTSEGSHDGSPLSRQVTVNLSQEQYERLFFQPNQPKGDLAKRFGKCLFWLSACMLAHK